MKHYLKSITSSRCERDIRQRPFLLRALILPCALALVPGAVFAEFDIAEKPLTVNRQAEPNVLYIQTSNSGMSDLFMPDGSYATYTLADGVTKVSIGDILQSASFNRQYYNPDITYQPPYKWENHKLISMGSGLVSVEPASARFTVKADGWTGGQVTFDNLNRKGYSESRYVDGVSYVVWTDEGKVSTERNNSGTNPVDIAALYYDYVPGYSSMRDNPEYNKTLDPNYRPESDPHNYEYWAFREAQAGAYFLYNGGNRRYNGRNNREPPVWGNRSAEFNRKQVEARACPTLFKTADESAAYHEALGNTITFQSSDPLLRELNGTKRGIPHATCLESYGIWGAEMPGTQNSFTTRYRCTGTAQNCEPAWSGWPGAPNTDPTKWGLPNARPWCLRQFPVNSSNKTISSKSIRSPKNNAIGMPIWNPISTNMATPTDETPRPNTCYSGRHRIGDTNGDGMFDINDGDLDQLKRRFVSHFKFRSNSETLPSGSASGKNYLDEYGDYGCQEESQGVCNGLGGPEQSLEHLITRFVQPDGSVKVEDTPRRRTGYEEIENFANWYAYYRTRLMATKSAASIAFSQLVDKDDTTKPGPLLGGGFARLGYDTTGNMEILNTNRDKSLGRGNSGSGVLPFRDFPSNALIPDTNTPHPYAGKTFVKDFYDWLHTKTGASGKKEARGPLDVAGKYYQTEAPWMEYPPLPNSNQPGKNISNDGKPFACRRAYTILMQDGYYADAGSANGQSPSLLNFNPAIVGGNNTSVNANTDCGKQPTVTFTDADGNVVRTTDGDQRFQFFNKAEYDAGKPQGPFCGENLTRFGGEADWPLRDTLADIAMYYWQNDLQPTIPNNLMGTQKDPAFWQHMQTFTIGLGISGRMSDRDINLMTKNAARYKNRNIFWSYKDNLNTDPEKVDDLMHAGLNGRGGTAAAADPEEFVNKLSQLLVEMGADAMGYGTGYMTPPGEVTMASVRTFYNIDGPWTGEVQGNKVQWCTEKKKQDGLCTTLEALMKEEAWSASEELRKRIEQKGFQDRKIFTWDGAQGVPFNTGLVGAVKDVIDAKINRDGYQDTCPFPRTGNAPCTLKDGQDYTVELLIDYLRGDSTYEEDENHSGFRDRTGSIGKNYLLDTINSTPYQLGLAGQGKSYVGHFDFGWAGWACGSDGPVADVDCGANKSFLSVNQIRAYHARLNEKLGKFHNEEDRGVAYVGGNDGMLHAFNVRDGKELFAFIPQAVHGKLKRLADPTYNDNHTYTVDGSPFASDVWLGGAWHSVVVGSTGRGGKSFFALDVENPEAFSSNNVLWEFANDDLGSPVNGEPVIQPVNGLGNHWAVTFGNGYNSKSHRAVLFVVELAKTATPNFRAIDTGVGSAAQPNGLSTPLLYDFDGDGLADAAYAGDILGNLWKFDLENMTVANGGQPLLKAASPDKKPQPFTAPPGVSIEANGNKIVQLVIGTGKHFEMKDITDQQVQSIYGVRDFSLKASMGTATRDRLLERDYARDDGEIDRFTEQDGSVLELPSWKLANTPNVEYDNVSGQMGYVIDMDGTGMSDLLSGISGWRVEVQGTDFSTWGAHYMLPTKVFQDDPCLGKDAGGIFEMEPIHGKWVKSRYWKATEKDSDVWKDKRTSGLEINRDDKGIWEGEMTLLSENGTASAYGYRASKGDNPRFVILGEKPKQSGDCIRIHIPGTDKSVCLGDITRRGRAGRISWRQIR